MFGMALRTYHRRSRELTQSGSQSGRTVWEAVLEFVQQNEPRSTPSMLATDRRKAITTSGESSSTWGNETANASKRWRAVTRPAQKKQANRFAPLRTKTASSSPAARD
jgi:hypothetical protein